MLDITTELSRPTQALTMIGALAPHLLPSAVAVREWLDDAALTPPVAGDNLALSDALVALRAGLPARVIDRQLKTSTEDAAHDAYFRIERVEPTPAALLDLVLHGRQLLLDFVRDSAPLDDHALVACMDQTLVDLLTCLRGGRAGDGVAAQVWTSTGAEREALVRWVRGHQVFVVITQGLVVAMRALAAAVKADDRAEVTRWTDLVVSLLDGTRAAFEFTGDFSVDEYTDRIRPSMMPPYTPFCLSGMMSVDHRHFVALVRDMKPALKALHASDPDGHTRIADGLRHVYDSHIHTCERFVGNQPSILSEGKTEKSGVSLLEHFRTIRLRPFTEAAVPQRLAPAPAAPAAASAPAPAACPFHK